jgi:uncharacterized integral membrane protein
MRSLCLLLLALFAAAVGFFAWQNHDDVTLKFWDRDLTVSLALVVAGAYLLGMLSGWTVVGMLRRGVERVIDRSGPPPR